MSVPARHMQQMNSSLGWEDKMAMRPLAKLVETLVIFWDILPIFGTCDAMHLKLIYQLHVTTTSQVMLNYAQRHSITQYLISVFFLNASAVISQWAVIVWQSLEASRLQPVLKQKDRAQEVSQRAMDLNDSFSKETERKLQEKMDAMQEKKNAQIRALLERLSIHVRILFCLRCEFSCTFYCAMAWGH